MTQGSAALLAVASLLLLPSLAGAAEAAAWDAPPWTVAPFVVLLLAIAVLPLVAGHFWHSNRNKAIVAALFAFPVAGYLFSQHAATDGRSTEALQIVIIEYGSFIILLASLYTISGGIALRGNLRARPLTNACFLALGAVIANFIGTTGASMLLIRPVLQTNRERRHTAHLPVFFIFMVSNLGGLLTPLGDPPLFLGYLRGVDFFWTLRLWPEWLVTNGIVLGVFLIWDTIASWRESPISASLDIRRMEPLRISGLINFVFLGGVVAAVLLPPMWNLPRFAGEGFMLLMAVLSLLLTPRGVRSLNAFTWGPIIEVAVIFAGIFVAMVPALVLLRARGAQAGLNALEPWQYFWLTGILSSFLDNAPTYLAFATMAAAPDALYSLMTTKPAVLEAISCGAVFMGANTYIGNGPNFMVKAIAEEAGYKPPSFFGYMVYSTLILLPIFVLVTFLFFPPAGRGLP